MTAHSIQLRKEARQLLWPWIAVTIGGLLSLVYLLRAQFSLGPLDFAFRLDLILPVGCFLGIPLLATLPLGSEFQHGTLTMLLAQPIDRRALWLQKLVIAFGAVLPAAILYLFAWRLWQEVGRDSWMAAAWMVATTAGAAAWTLIARSTIGGVALSSGAYWILFVVWLYVSDHLPGNVNRSAAFHWATGILLLGYCVALVWLGRRMFLRFQAAEGVLGRETLTLAPATRFLPQIGWDWLRPRPRGAILNLIRREIHLLRFVWLLSLFSLAMWIFLVALRIVKPYESWDDTPAIFLAVLLSFLISLLAGALSLGEEKTSGTHAWHLTLPLSQSLQWLIKLSFALLVSLLCATGIPLGVLLARGWLAGAPLSYLGHTPVWVRVFGALSTTLLAFWCSSMVKGTARAVLYVFPVLLAMGLASASGNWLAFRAVARGDGLLDTVLSGADLFKLNRTLAVVADPRDDLRIVFAVILGPLLIFGLIQSLRMFCAQKESRKLHAVRSALPLLATLLISSFALASFFLFARRLQSRQQDVLHEAHLAIQSLEANTMDAAQLQRFKIEDLARAHPLSDGTRYWLRDSTILVRVKPTSDSTLPPRIQWPFEYANTVSGTPGQIVRPYSATIHMAGGSECNLNFWTAGQAQWGILTEACQ